MVRAGVGVLMAVLTGSLVLASAAFASTPRDRSEPPGKETVEFDGDYEAGTLVVKTSERRLYLALGNGRAYRYAIAVGEPIRQWEGSSWVSSKRRDPDWRPTARMRRDDPRLPAYMPPGPRNPLGTRAIYIGWSEYRIHGTTKPWSIGTATSNGCFRMHKADVEDLFERVHIGAPVIVLR